MVKVTEESTAPVTSKYAAKKKARISKGSVEQPVVAETEVEKTEQEHAVESVKTEPVVAKTAAVKEEVKADKPQPKQAGAKKGKTVVGKNNEVLNMHVPEHILEIAYMVKDNCAIRRFTALGIINHLKQVGVIKEGNKANYVNFMWNKFKVSSNNLSHEYEYTEPFFLKALIASFGQFAANAQTTISNFMDEEGIDGVFE